MSSSYINVANLPKDVFDRLRVVLDGTTKDNISEQTINGVVMIDLMCALIVEQQTTNRYLAEMLGDKIRGDEI